MSAEIVMPRLSDSMEEGTILKWLKSDGDEVARGEPIAEIETDKATLTFESDAAGVLTIVAPVGETLPIGSVIARLDANGASAPAAAPPQAAEPPAAVVAAPSAGAPAPAPVATAATAGERVKASPLARRVARERGVDLHAVTGTGPGGRIVKEDVERAAAAPAAPPVTAEAAAAAPPPAAAPAPARQPEPEPEPAATVTAAAPPRPPAPAVAAPSPPPLPGTAKGEVTVQEPTRTQGLIARRMAESKATIPDFTLTTEVDMEACVTLRADLKALAGDVPSYNDMIVKASALALRDFPRANGSYRDGRFELYSRVNVGIAVATAGALVVPTVFDADVKPLREIAREARALAERVRNATITPPEVSGGTFTVSNLGMYGITEFTAVINPPQAAILAVGELAPRPVVTGGELAVRNTLRMTLACDHRILYGAEAAEFLARIRALLERPIALVY